ncbi:metallophosphoesterase [Streptomyces sp. NPDC093970]|uniref:metallophosphoesterase family protein n=1 Tax=Streptomyces sp. NPDC093970 TaxID=3155076 RepID=UPI00343A2AFE
MRILHLSDTHLDRTDAPNRRGVNATASLRLMLDELGGLTCFDAVVVTGDLADEGAVEAYTALRTLIGGYARERNIPLFCTTGNHDEREAFAKVLGSGHLAADGTDRAEQVFGGEEVAAVSTVGGRRFITLDSLVPGKVYGRLGAPQLEWLREVLRTPAEHGTVLAFHHPPFALDLSVTQPAFGLRDPGDLAAAIRGGDVRMILNGHYHLQLFGLLESVPVWVTPGVVNRIDLSVAPGERAVRGASASLVELGGPSGPLCHTFHARDPRAHETVYEIDEAQAREFVARHG